MVLDDIFSFITREIATILSIIVIVIAAVRGINKASDVRIDKAKQEITHDFQQQLNEIKHELETVKQYIERDLNRHERMLERLYEIVSKTTGDALSHRTQTEYHHNETHKGGGEGEEYDRR